MPEYDSVEFTFAWWFPAYLKLLVAFCLLCRTVPDEARLERMIYRAMRVAPRKRNGG